MGGNALMRAQYTDLGDDDVIDRGTLAPLVTYRDGRTGVGLPKIVHGPLAAWNRLLAGGYQPGTNDRHGVEDAFEAAGAAMAGGAFATRPAGALASGAARRYRDMATAAEVEPWRVREMLIEDAGRRGANGPYPAYRGSEHVGMPTEGPVWGSSNPRVAGTYADFGSSDTANVMPLEFRFQNPLTVNAQGREFTHVPYAGSVATTDEIAEHAGLMGHDGVIFRRVTDAANGAGIPQTTYAALQRGTVYSPITGELVYSRGSPAASLMQQYRGEESQDNALMRYR